jgi:hypothetical protein
MFVIREVLRCKPGQVRPMVEKFKAISQGLRDLGHPPLRLLTDVTGEPFWTVIAEAQVERVDDFFNIERQLTSNDKVRAAMADYHALVESGRREIYRVET